MPLITVRNFYLFFSTDFKSSFLSSNYVLWYWFSLLVVTIIICVWYLLRWYRRMEKRAVTNIARARTTNENYWKTITSVTKTFLIFLHTVIRINKAVIIASQVLPEKDGRVLLLHFLCVLSLLE